MIRIRTSRPKALAAVAASAVAVSLLAPASAQGETQKPLRLLSVAPDGTIGNNWSGGGHISADGARVAFWSQADNLFAGDTNGVSDIFIRDLATGATSVVSSAYDGGPADGASFRVLGIDGVGRRVVFASDATNLVADDPGGGVFIRDTVTGTTSRLPVPEADQGVLSADGRTLAFVTWQSLLPEDADSDAPTRFDAYVLDIPSGELSLVSADQHGASGRAWSVSMTADAERVVYYTSSPMVAADTDVVDDVYVWDAATRESTLITAPVEGPVVEPVISRDGGHLAFSVIVTDGGVEARRLYVRDLASGATTLASVTPAGAASKGTTWPTAVSDGGRYVAMYSDATDLVAGANPTGSRQVFLRDMTAATTILLSATAQGVAGDDWADFRHLTAMSADGRRIVFASRASNLAAGDTNGASDVFLWDAGGVPATAPTPPATTAPTTPATPTTSTAPVPAAPAPSTSPALANTVKPAGKGTPRVGQTLKVTSGTWSMPVKLSYQWLANGKVVRKATASRLRLTRAHAGKKVAVRVVARATGQAPVKVTVVFKGRVRR